MSVPDSREPSSAARQAAPHVGSGVLAMIDARGRSVEPLRFLQASDFRLDTPCYGVMNLPAGVRDRFVDARYLAAERVFDAAIEHEVDFLVVPGGLLDARLPGLRGPWFLAEQFSRLAEHNIAIYWAGTSYETRGRWPAHAQVPANVHCLTADHSGHVYLRNERPAARLRMLPQRKDDAVPIDNDGLYTIAVQPRSAQFPQCWVKEIDYWALGGRSNRETKQEGAVVAHFAGSPQGRSPAEFGRHSCSLVDVDSQGAVRIQPINTDVVCWHHERLEVDASISWRAWQQRLLGVMTERHAESTAELLMMHWTVTGSGLVMQRLLQPRFNAELVSRLNTGQPGRLPAVWTVHIEAVIEPAQRNHWQQQDTSLGAFLRELNELAPHIHEVIGASANAADRFDVCAAEPNDCIVQLVLNEGVHRLGTDDELTTAGAV